MGSLHQIPTPVLSLSISVHVLAYAYNQPLSHEKSYKIGNFIIIRVLCKIDAVTLNPGGLKNNTWQKAQGLKEYNNVPRNTQI